MNSLPGYLWLLVFACAVATPLVVSVGLYRGAAAAGESRRTATAMAAVMGVSWIAWVITSAVLAARHLYRQDPIEPNPWIPIALLGALLSALAAARIPAVARALAQSDTLVRLTLPQIFRVVGAAFVAAWLLGELPPQFAIPAGFGDIAVGVAAPFIARRLARGEGRRAAVIFNLMGILDLVVAVGLGVATGLGEKQLLHTDPSTDATTILPLVVIPTTIVPLAIALHILSLRRLRRR